MAEPGWKWVVMRDAPKFADLFQRGVPGSEIASYVTSAVCCRFEFIMCMVRALGGAHFFCFSCAPYAAK